MRQPSPAHPQSSNFRPTPAKGRRKERNPKDKKSLECTIPITSLGFHKRKHTAALQLSNQIIFFPWLPHGQNYHLRPHFKALFLWDSQVKPTSGLQSPAPVLRSRRNLMEHRAPVQPRIKLGLRAAKESCFMVQRSMSWNKVAPFHYMPHPAKLGQLGRDFSGNKTGNVERTKGKPKTCASGAW